MFPEELPYCLVRRDVHHGLAEESDARPLSRPSVPTTVDFDQYNLGTIPARTLNSADDGCAVLGAVREASGDWFPVTTVCIHPRLNGMLDRIELRARHVLFPTAVEWGKFVIRAV